MGNIVNMSCENCGYREDYKVGAGMLSVNADVVKKLLLEQDVAEWSRLYDSGRIRFFMWEYELAYCHNCEDVKSVVTVKLQTKDGDEIRLGCRCDKCKSKLKSFTMEDDIICPKCKKSILSHNLNGIWD